MIKIEGKRYNPDHMKKYYPGYQLDNPSITIIWKDGQEEDIVFKDEEERDKHIEAMDEAMLIVKDGVVVERVVNSIPPFIFEGGEFGGPGGIPMQ